MVRVWRVVLCVVAVLIAAAGTNEPVRAQISGCHACEACYFPPGHKLLRTSTAIIGYLNPHDFCLSNPWCEGHPTCQAALAPSTVDSVAELALAGDVVRMQDAVERYSSVQYDSELNGIFVRGCPGGFRAFIPLPTAVGLSLRHALIEVPAPTPVAIARTQSTRSAIATRHYPM